MAPRSVVSQQLVRLEGEAQCAMSDEADYVFQGDWLKMLGNVSAAEQCCSQCYAQEKCHGWSWVKSGGSGRTCWLKGGFLVEKVAQPGLVSGLMARAGETSAGAAKNAGVEEVAGAEESSVTTPKPTTTTAPTTTPEPTTTTAEPTTTTPEPTTTTGEPTTTTPENSCPGPDENGGCLKSQCCKEAGYQCFAKNDYWAECMLKCEPGPNLFEESGNEPWTCEALGERAPGTPKQCSARGENCLESQCCSEHGFQCYGKNATFGTCKPACTPGVDMGDEDWKPWTCDALGARAKAPASWISKKCAPGADNCAQSRCCAGEGMQCFLQNQYYGQCKPSCAPGQGSKCTPAGPKTPKLAATIASSKGKVGPWVEAKCAKQWGNCLDSGCCQEVGTQCYTKTKDYGACRRSCNVSAVDPQDNKTWDCEGRGPRSWGLATKGYPSLYCVSLYMPEHYEGPLLKSVLKKNAGIFQCDGYDVYAATNDTLGTSADGIKVESVLIPKINVGKSQDGTAGNAKLFMAVWDKIIAGGRFHYYDWTVKVDPDAVLLPWRLRDHMAPHIGEHVYVVNCNKFPSSPNFPMMYGALEVFSQSAMLAYAASSWKCGTQLPWNLWGEDYYMTHCMDFIGVGRIGDFSVLGDNMCTGANCGDLTVASFHPFKTQESWHQCWDTANGHPPPPPQVPRLRK